MIDPSFSKLEILGTKEEDLTYTITYGMSPRILISEEIVSLLVRSCIEGQKETGNMTMV